MRTKPLPIERAAVGICCLAIAWWAAVSASRADVDRALVDRSDLIIVATPQDSCSGYFGEGPLADGVHPTPEYRQFLPRLKVTQLLKGDIDKDKPLLVCITALVYGPKDGRPPLDPGKPVFKLHSTGADVGPPGAPRKGTSYIFFLENLVQREPGSRMALGNEKIIYRNFDFHSAMILASPAAISQVERLTKP
jgi:hypothetical protein